MKPQAGWLPHLASCTQALARPMPDTWPGFLLLQPATSDHPASAPSPGAARSKYRPDCQLQSLTELVPSSWPGPHPQAVPVPCSDPPTCLTLHWPGLWSPPTVPVVPRPPSPTGTPGCGKGGAPGKPRWGLVGYRGRLQDRERRAGDLSALSISEEGCAFCCSQCYSHQPHQEPPQSEGL